MQDRTITRLTLEAGGLILLLGLSACGGKKDVDSISNAQNCLDQSTSSTALACMNQVQGINSPAANIIRCSAYFMDQGFTDPTRLQEVAGQLQATGSPTTVLAAMAFSSSKYSLTQNNSLASSAFDACQASGSSGLIFLASATRIATAALALIGSFDTSSGTLPTATQVKSSICSGSGGTATTDSTTLTVMGAAALAAYQQNCVVTKSTDPVCSQYSTAAASSSDPATVGSTLATSICSTP